MSYLLIETTLLMATGAFWGIAVGEREAYTWKQGMARKNFVFTFIDYHGNRMVEVYSIFANLLLISMLDLMLLSKVFLVVALLAFSHMFYRFAYNLNYYGYLWVNKQKVDNIYRVFGWKIPHPPTKFLVSVYVLTCLVMSLLILYNEMSWNL